jgi:hypothetical protein
MEEGISAIIILTNACKAAYAYTVTMPHTRMT